MSIWIFFLWKNPSLLKFQNFCHPHYKIFITSQILRVKAYFKLLWKVYREEQHQYEQKYENSKRLCCLNGWEKIFFEVIMTLKIPDMKLWNLLFEKCPTYHFVWMPQYIECMFSSVHPDRIIEYKWIYHWTLMLLENFKELSFKRYISEFLFVIQ